MIPLTIRFDGAANIEGSSVVRLPKLNQGAPYRFSLRIRNEDTTYRTYTDVIDMRWRIKLRPSDSQDLMVLTKTNGNFDVTTTTTADDTLSFVVNAADWANVEIPRSSNHMEMDVPFSFVVEILDAGGAVTERFAQGSGLISVSMT